MASTEAVDLTAANEEIKQVKEYAQKNFGFFGHRVNPIWTQPDPADACAFECAGVNYEIQNGKISVTYQGDSEE